MWKNILNYLFPVRKLKEEYDKYRLTTENTLNQQQKMIMENQEEIKKLYHQVNENSELYLNKISENEENISKMMSLFHEKHEMIMEDRDQINKAMTLFHEKHEMIMEDRDQINKAMTLFHEKHEMIMEDRSQINKLMGLLHEKHEMIMEDRNQINRIMELFHEKHEMILADRREIRYLLRSVILNYYKDIKATKEQEEVLNWIKLNTVQMYPYDFYYDYMNKSVNIDMDADGWKYILYNESKLYFPKEFSDDMIKQYFLFLIMEQDKRSPHCYFDEDYTFEKNNILIDVGAAEGLISLLNIDKAKKIYLIECEAFWCEALEKTFQPYRDKVTIVNKIASSNLSDDSITLKELIKPEELYTIKIDVEGNELDVLNSLYGATLKENCKIVVCAYHKQQDEQIISEFFRNNNIQYTHTKGYLLSDWGGYAEPYLRRGLLRGSVKQDIMVKEI